MKAPLGNSSTRRMKIAGISMAIMMAALVSTAQAVPVAVPNFSFESPGISGAQATDWTSNGGAPSGGVNDFSFGFTSASDGVYFHYLNLPTFGGPNPSVTESNATLIGNAGVGTYTLTVAGGRRSNDATTDGSYVIELLAGGIVIGSQTVNDPFNTYAPDTWHDITATAIVFPGDAAVGQDLSIRLSAYDGTGGIRSQGQFDNVRLYFTPTTLLLQYDPVGPQSSDTPLAATYTDPSVTGTVLSQTGLEVWTNSNVWPVGRISGSPTIVLGEYIEFTISPQNGAAIAFTSLTYDKASYLGNGATVASIRSSVDGYAADVSVVAVSPAGNQSLSFDLSSLPTASSPVTFRIYFYGAPTDRADWDDLLSTAIGYNGLRVTGVVDTTGGFFAAVRNVHLNGGGSEINVLPGETVNLSLDYTTWNSSGCPGCIAQIVIGIDNTGVDCAYDDIPGVYPGQSAGATLALTAPAAPGTYEIRWTHDLQFTCGAAVANYPSGSQVVIGTIHVGASGNFFAAVKNVSLNGGGPSISVPPGAAVDLNLDYTVWNSSGCSNCIDQIVIGIDNTGVDCAYDDIPGVYPGQSAGATLALTAPAAPGTYEIRWTHDLQFSCADALANYPNRPQQVIGYITVNPLLSTPLADAVARFAISSVTPNPTRGSAMIAYTVARETHVRLSVVDVQGREVAELKDAVLQPGRYEATWHGVSARGAVAAGVYFVRYEAADQTTVRRVVLVR